MIRKLDADQHTVPFKGPFTITRIHPGDIIKEETGDTAFGPLSVIDHAVMKKGLTIRMHEHVNDEILSYVWQGTMYHKDSAGIEAAVSTGKLMMMNAGAGFWHEEKVKEDQVEMLQIFIRPRETNLEPQIQFYEKIGSNQGWYLLAGPEGSHAPLYVRQNVFIFDAHTKKGEALIIPEYPGFQPFLYVVDGVIKVDELEVRKKEAVTDISNPLSSISTIEDSSIVLFFVDMDAPMSLDGTISGKV